MSACLLAFDTSTEQLAVGLLVGGAAFTHVGAGGAQSSAVLLPQIQSLMTQAGIVWSQIDVIAFGRGPGAFTGLRTSCAVAQGLALGLDRPVLALDSLLVVAEDARAQWAAAGADELEIAVAMDARMGEIYAGRYRHGGGRWQTLDAPALYTLDALTQQWQQRPPALVAGSALAAFDQRLSWPAAAPALPQERDRAAALLRLAALAFEQGETLSADEALPVYLRDKVALTTAERAAQRAAADEAAR